MKIYLRLGRKFVTVFSLGFVIGVLSVLLFEKNEKTGFEKNSCAQRSYPEPEGYGTWFSRKGLFRSDLDYDMHLYGSDHRASESEYLFAKISLVCAVYVRKFKNIMAIKHTWGKHCNEVVFFSLQKNDTIPVIHFKAKNSFHFLCDTIRYIWEHYHLTLQWVIFVPDDLFVVPQNLRFYVAPLDHTVPYYLGHPLTFWGQVYNVGQAGYVLSKGTVDALQAKFNSTEACLAGGKYWKNEDFYLGKHLGDLGIIPRDTRDQRGRSRFHGYSFNQLLFPGRLSILSSYWRRSVYPVIEGLGCCSDRSITFHGIESDKMYLYDYLLNHLRVFYRGGHHGNQPASTPIPEDQVWQEFLKQEGKENVSISSEEFFELWKSKISAPDMFNEHMRQEHLHTVSGTGFAHMPHVLENMLVAVHSNDSIDNV